MCTSKATKKTRRENDRNQDFEDNAIVSLKKREWCYIQKPSVYSVECDICGGTNITWSEYEEKIWCFDCEIDTDGTGGVFTGPINYELSKMIGLSFDRIRLSDNVVLKFTTIDGELQYVEEES